MVLCKPDFRKPNTILVLAFSPDTATSVQSFLRRMLVPHLWLAFCCSVFLSALHLSVLSPIQYKLVMAQMPPQVTTLCDI